MRDPAGRPHNKVVRGSYTKNTALGINIPNEMVFAVDKWAELAGYMRQDGSTNRSGAIRALLMMALADSSILDAAVRAKKLALMGGISERLRALYTQVHKIMMDEINELDV
jgi:hypothetical protein